MIKEVNVCLWDDFLDGESTEILVESSLTSDTEDQLVIDHVRDVIIKSGLMESSNLSINHVPHWLEETSVLYPVLNIEKCMYDDVDKIVNLFDIEENRYIGDYKITFYAES